MGMALQTLKTMTMIMTVFPITRKTPMVMAPPMSWTMTMTTMVSPTTRRTMTTTVSPTCKKMPMVMAPPTSWTMTMTMMVSPTARRPKKVIIDLIVSD